MREKRIKVRCGAGYFAYFAYFACALAEMNLVDLARAAIPDTPGGRTATPAEAAELRALVALIYAGEGDRREALAAAIADPEAALASFRALAAELRPFPSSEARPKRDPNDDRRTCEECANLDRQGGRDGFRRCAAARRGERIDNAGRDYSPVPDQPRRCERYRPRAGESDQRTGAERWPWRLNGS